MKKLRTVKYIQDESIAVITINRPDAMNSFNEALRSDLLFAFNYASEDQTIKAIILNGNGRNFSAGADLKDTNDSEKSLQEILNKEYRPIFDSISNAEKPVIASIHGSAAGIGLSLALNCDLLIMAEDAFLLAPFTTISLAPDGGMNWFLVNQLGYRRAFQLCIESERIEAKYCIKHGLANKMVEPEKLHKETIEWAKNLTKRAPLSVRATKKIMRHANSSSWAKTYDMEVPIQQALIDSEDFQEGVSAFLEKRDPKFKDR